MGRVDALTDFESRELIRFFLHGMSQETRGELMAKLPLTYVRLFPHTPATVVEKVAVAVDAVAKKAA